MNVQDAYIAKMAAQLKEWNAEIKLLEAKMEKAGADFNVKRAEEMRDLRARQLAAVEKLKDLEQSSGQAWDEVKATSDKVWEDLKAGVAAAHSKFK